MLSADLELQPRKTFAAYVLRFHPLCVASVTVKIMMNFGNNEISGCVSDMLVNISLSLLYVSAVLGTHSIASYHVSYRTMPQCVWMKTCITELE